MESLFVMFAEAIDRGKPVRAFACGARPKRRPLDMALKHSRSYQMAGAIGR
jgi:hypothetical protein